MSNNQQNQRRYTNYPGKYICKNKSCKQLVKNARLYEDTHDLTWFCSNRHLSVVSLKRNRGY